MEDKIKERKSGIDHLAFGGIVLIWGVLLVLKQVGIMTVSTLPFVFAAFGALLVISGAVKLRRSRNSEHRIKGR